MRTAADLRRDAADLGMFSKKDKYASAEQDAGGGLDDLSRKLAVDLRKHVKKLESHRAYSKEWVTMVDSLTHIANIAAMEHRLPEAANSTLWEGDQLTVRFLLEEGKLNLCMRLMHEYKRAQRATGAAELAQLATAAGVETAEKLAERSLAFEQSLGTLLRCSFEHIEAVQTTDMPELFQHAAEVLSLAVERGPPAEGYERTQEAGVLSYLALTFNRVESIGEEKLMPHVEDHGLIALVVSHLHACTAPGRSAHALSKDALLDGCRFLHHAFDTEDYPTRRKKLLPPDAKERLAAFKPQFLGEFTADHEGRKHLRALVDEVTRSQP